MKAFVDGLDYIVLLNYKELETLEKGRFLESPLILKGEIPTDKTLQIVFKPKTVELVSKRFMPKNSDWDKLKRVVLTINQKGLDRFFRGGQGICHAGDLNSDFLIRWDPAA